MNAETKTASATSDTEPTFALTVVPMWLIVLTLGLLFGSALAFDRHGGWFDAKVYRPFVSIPDQFQPPPLDENPLYARGREVFKNCAACHQANGLGSTALNAPPLVGSEWVLSPGPDRMIRIVLDGLTGPIEVLGKPYGAGTMTAFKKALSDEDIAAVLTFVRQNREWKHNASAVTPEQVAAIRKETAARDANWNATELLKVPEGK